MVRTSLVTSVATATQQFTQSDLQKSCLGEQSLPYSRFETVSVNPDSFSAGRQAFA